MKQLAVPSFTVFGEPRHDCAVRAALRRRTTSRHQCVVDRGHFRLVVIRRHRAIMQIRTPLDLRSRHPRTNNRAGFTTLVQR